MKASKYSCKKITDFRVIKNVQFCSYQNGPDTYLLQLRDTDFPVRLREYMKVACNRSPGFSRTITEENFDWRVIKNYEFEFKYTS